MDYEHKINEWGNEGVPPDETREKNGFRGGYHPPAGIFNWFFSKITKIVNELQRKLTETDNKFGTLTKNNIGLDKVENTKDSEKHVAYAEKAGKSGKVENDIIVRFNGGDTEGVDKWTFDGSAGKSINITADKLNAAKKIHSHTLDDVTETANKKFSRIVTATSTDGANYTATVEGITELYNGMEITIIPNKRSAARNLYLNVNGLGAKQIKQPLGKNTKEAAIPDFEDFLYENTPCKLCYSTNGEVWLIAGKQKTSAQDLYGNVPIANGGTGASTAEEALKNLGAFPRDGSIPMIGNKLELFNKWGWVFANSNMTQVGSSNNGEGVDDTDSRFIAIRNSNYSSGIASAVALFERVNGSDTSYELYGEHNKTSDSYTGTGKTRTIATNGVGSCLLIHIKQKNVSSGKYYVNAIAIVTKYGALYCDTGSETMFMLKDGEHKSAYFENGILHLTDSVMYGLNDTDKMYEYQVL